MPWELLATDIEGASGCCHPWNSEETPENAKERNCKSRSNTKRIFQFKKEIAMANMKLYSHEEMLDQV